ncbi:MAG: DUF5652 family protein [Bacillota bacterium]
MSYFSQHPFGLLFPLLILVVVWTLVIKGIALWKAARHDHRAWFIILLVVNTLGILELIYLFWLSRRSRASVASSPTPEVQQ